MDCLKGGGREEVFLRTKGGRKEKDVTVFSLAGVFSTLFFPQHLKGCHHCIRAHIHPSFLLS